MLDRFVARCSTSAADPGRLVVELAEQGIPALGVDQADHGVSGDADQQTVGDALRHQRRTGFGQLDTQHQALSANFLDATAGQFSGQRLFQGSHQMGADTGCVAQQIVLFH